MSASPTNSRPSWRSSPSLSSHYRGVQTGMGALGPYQEPGPFQEPGPYQRPAPYRELERPQMLKIADHQSARPMPQMLDPAAYMFPRPAPAAATTEAPKTPVYDYKPTALRWWFMAVLVAVLVTLTAVTEHSLRSLPDYGLGYDLQRLACSISQRNSPATMPRVRNVTAETDSRIPAGPEKTAVVIPQIPQSSSNAPTMSTTAVTKSPASAQTAPNGTPTAATGDPLTATQMKPTVPTTSAKPSFDSGVEESATQPEASKTYTPHTPSAASQTSASQKSGSGPLTGHGEHQTLDKSVASAKVAQTSTSICFDCSVDFSTPTSAYLSLVTATSTTSLQTIIDGKGTTVKTPTTVQADPAQGGLPSTTTVQQPTTLPETTIIVQHVTTDSAGRTSSQSVTSIVRETTSTMASAVVLHPGQSWVTTTGPVTTSTISSKTALQTTIIAGGNGETVTSVYWTTLAPTTVVVTATYGTVIGAGSRPAAPTGTAASSSDTAANSMVGVVGISRSQYLSGSFLPTLIAVLVAMPLKTIGINARLFQPFITLKASPAGATAEASVFLRLHGWRNAILSFPRAVILRQPVVLVGQLLVVGSALLAPLAAEAVRVYVPDGCTGKCPGSLGVDITAGRILQVLMALLISLLVGMAALLAWLKTGVKQHPWSIAGMAALCVNREMKGLLKKIGRGLGGEIDDSEFSHVLGKHGFTLGCDGDDSPYGIRVTTFPVLSGGDLLRRKTSDGKEQAWKSEVGRTAPAVPLYLLTLQGRIFLLLCFTAVLVLLLGYENSWGTSNFERFMNDQGFGVRFLFTALGVALGFSMSAFFRSVAVLSPYLMMSQRALPAQTCILVSPASNTFSGVYSAFRQRHLYLGVVAATSLLADFLPVTLSHVPFSVLETHEAQYTCAYLSIAILVMMILVVAGSLAVRWPHMPADPRTIAGALYYLCDSGILDSFSGLAAAEPRDRNWMVKSMCVQYRFGNMIGLSGKERICIDAVDPGVTEEGGRS